MIGEFLAAVGGHLGGEMPVPRWALYGLPLAAFAGGLLWGWAALVGERTRRLAAERAARYAAGRVRVQQQTVQAVTRALPTLAGSDLPPRGAAVLDVTAVAADFPPPAVLSDAARREVDEDTAELVRQLRTGEQPETVTLHLAARRVTGLATRPAEGSRTSDDVEPEPEAELDVPRDEQRVAGGPPFGPRYVWPEAGQPGSPVGVPPRGYGWLSRSATAAVGVAPRWLLAALVLAGLGMARVVAAVRPWLAGRQRAVGQWAARYRARGCRGRHEAGPREVSWWDVAREQSLRWAAERDVEAQRLRYLLAQRTNRAWRGQLAEMRLALLPPSRGTLPELECTP